MKKSTGLMLGISVIVILLIWNFNILGLKDTIKSLWPTKDAHTEDTTEKDEPEVL